MTLEEAVNPVLDKTGLPYGRTQYDKEPLPDVHIVWFPVSAPGDDYSNRTRAERFRIQVTLYTRDSRSADATMRTIEEAFESAGFVLTGTVGEDRFPATGHYSRRRDFKIRLKRRDFNASDSN